MLKPAGSTAVAEWRRHWTLALSVFWVSALATVSTTTLGVMIAPIEQETGWTRAQITSGPALMAIAGILLATAAGVAIDRFGFRRIGIIMAFLMFGSTAALSMVTDNLWTWLACWSVFAVAAAAGPTVWMTPIVSTFHASRGLALIVTGCGTVLTTTFGPLIASFLVQHYGWRLGYVGLGLIWGGIAIPIMFLFFRRPRDAQAAIGPMDKAETQAQRAPPAELQGLTAREGFRSPAFYKLLIGGLCNNMVGTAMSMNLVPILMLEGLSLTVAAAAAGVMGASMLVGKLIGALLLDRIDAKLIAAAAPVGAMLMPFLFLFMPGSFAAAATGIAVYGVMSGLKGATGTYLFSRHLGTRAFGTLNGTLHAISHLGIGLAPIAASLVYDTTRSYDPLLWFALPVLALSAVLYLSLGRYPEELPRRAAMA